MTDGFKPIELKPACRVAGLSPSRASRRPKETTEGEPSFAGRRIFRRKTTSSSSSRTSWPPSWRPSCPFSRPSSPPVPSTTWSCLLSSLKLPHHIDEAPNGRNRLVEHGLLGLVQVDFDHFLY